MYFKSGFVCRIRLRNTCPHKQSNGPEPVNWRGKNLFFYFLKINFTAMLSYAYLSDIVIITLKLLL